MRAMLFIGLLLSFAKSSSATFGGDYLGGGHSGYHPVLYIGGGLRWMKHATAGGGDALFLGNIGKRFLLGAGISGYQGKTSQTYGYSSPDLDYRYTTLNMSANLGMWLFRAEKSELSLQFAVGDELVMFGAQENAHTSFLRYSNVASNNFWTLRPGLMYAYHERVAIYASYNILIPHYGNGLNQLAFGESSDFDGPQVSFILSTRRNRYSNNNYSRKNWFHFYKSS